MMRPGFAVKARNGKVECLNLNRAQRLGACALRCLNRAQRLGACALRNSVCWDEFDDAETLADKIDAAGAGKQTGQLIVCDAVDFDVEILGFNAKEGIADGSADDEGTMAGSGEATNCLIERGWQCESHSRYDCTLVDIHSHVLHGMDDGAKTFDDSLAMVRMAAESGTTHLVATPHANSVYGFEPEVIRERLVELAAASDSTVKLYSGCDFHLSFDNIEDAVVNPRKYTINRGRYLLVEFSDLLIFHNTGDIFRRLMEAGMIPIITHPERNALLRQRIQQIGEWVEKGALVQVTGSSLVGHFGKRAQQFSKELLDAHLVHFIASDGHDLRFRPPKMDSAAEWLTKNYSEALAKRLCTDNPQAVVEDQPLPEFDAANNESPRKWYRLWRQ